MANTTEIHGGYSATPAHTVSILEGLIARAKAAGGSAKFVAGCDVACTERSQFDNAVRAATGKVAILAMGIDATIEGEGKDRKSTALPGSQEVRRMFIAACGTLSTDSACVRPSGLDSCGRSGREEDGACACERRSDLALSGSHGQGSRHPRVSSHGACCRNRTRR